MRITLSLIILILLSGCSKPKPSTTIPVIDTSTLAPEAAVAINKAITDVSSLGTANEWTTLGLYFQAHGLDEEAILAYQTSIELPSTPYKTEYWLAIAFAKLGYYQEAINACSRYTTYPPAFWRRGYWYIDVGNVEEAADMFDQAIAVDPRAVAALVGLARTRLQQNKPDEAVRILEGIRDRGGNHPYLSYLLGTSYQRAGRNEDAGNLLSKPATGPPKWADPWLDEMKGYQRGFAAAISRATAKLDQGDTTGALISLKLLSKSYPRHPVVLTNLATVHLQLGDLESAIKICGDSIRWNPTHAPSQLTMALALTQRGDFIHAAQYASEAISLQGSNSQAHALAGQIAFRNRNLQAAVLHLEQAIAIGSNNPTDREMLGMIYLEFRKFDHAAKQFELVLSINPTATRSIGGLALALGNSGRRSQALAILRKAITKYPQDQNLQRASQLLSQIGSSQ